MNIKDLKEGIKIKFHYWGVVLKGIIKEINWTEKKCLVIEPAYESEIMIYFDDIEKIETEKETCKNAYDNFFDICFICSECGKKFVNYCGECGANIHIATMFNYCPNCGRKIEK